MTVWFEVLGCSEDCGEELVVSCVQRKEDGIFEFFCFKFLVIGKFFYIIFRIELNLVFLINRLFKRSWFDVNKGILKFKNV